MKTIGAGTMCPAAALSAPGAFPAAADTVAPDCSESAGAKKRDACEILASTSPAGLSFHLPQNASDMV